MQPCTTAWEHPELVDHHEPVDGHQADQVSGWGDRTAADAGAPGTGPGRRHASAVAVAGAVSGRMSIRQPVSRAASRAFWPSRPMASESW